MAYVIEHKYPKDKALTMVKKAISGKFAIIKDNGFTLKAGAPTSPVTIEITDTNVTVSGGAMAKLFIDPVGSEIKLYFEENKNNAPTGGNAGGNAGGAGGGCSTQEYFNYQEKGISILKSYKDLLDSGIISEEEFNAKKAEVMDLMRGSQIQSNAEDASKEVSDTSKPDNADSVSEAQIQDYTESASEDEPAQNEVAVAKNEKKHTGIWATVNSVLNVISLMTLIVGIAFLVIAGYIDNEATGIFDSYIKIALSGEILSLLTVAGTIVVFILLIVQLYFDISKTTTYKKALPLAIITTLFNAVSVVTGFISVGESRYYTGILVFSILASACLLFVFIRLISISACKAKNKDIYVIKENGKKALALLLSLVLLISVFGGTIVKENLSKNEFIFNLTYEHSSNKLCAAVYACCGDEKNVVIPKTYKGYDVIAISEYAFAYNKNITSVEIPDGVTDIYRSAFALCSSLESIVIPYGVTSIAYETFYGCSSLESIVIPDSVTSIEDFAFAQCISLTSIVIPESVRYIEACAFERCDNLTIYCEAESQPDGWDGCWNNSELPVIWGYNK